MEKVEPESRNFQRQPGGNLASAGNLSTAPQRKLNITLNGEQIKLLTDLHYRLWRGYGYRSVRVTDTVSFLNATVNEARVRYASSELKQWGPRDRILSLVACCMVAGAYPERSAAVRTLKDDVFPTVVLNNAEQHALLATADRLTALRRSATPPTDEVLEKALQQEIARVAATEQVSSLGVLAAQAFCVGATVENYDLSDRYAEQFFDYLSADHR